MKVRQPQPTLNDLHALADQVDVAGLEFELAVSGVKGQLSPGLELAGYRLVQEALTNVLRHSGRPVNVTARVDYGEDAVSLSVVDDGLGAAASAATQGAGHGLMGMREPSVTRTLIEEFARSDAHVPMTPNAAIESLTAREVEVWQLMAKGMSNQEIAADLILGETTVKTHVSRVLMKLGLRDRAQAVVAAYETGLIHPGDQL